MPLREVQSSEEQLTLWRDGESVHHRYGNGPQDYECTPDFSCCTPELLASADVRETFVQATARGRDRMLGKFLRRLLDVNGLSAHVIGG